MTYSLSHPTKHYRFIYEENYLDGQTFDPTRRSLGTHTANSNSQLTKMKW